MTATRRKPVARLARLPIAIAPLLRATDPVLSSTPAGAGGVAGGGGGSVDGGGGGSVDGGGGGSVDGNPDDAGEPGATIGSATVGCDARSPPTALNGTVGSLLQRARSPG